MNPDKKKKLQAKLRALLREGDALHALDSMTPAQQTRAGEVNTELDSICAELEVPLQRGDFEEKKRALTAPTEQPIERGDGDTDPYGEQRGDDNRRVEVRSRKWSELRQLCGSDGADAGEWASKGEFLAAVASGRHHPNLRSQSTLVDDLGGFAVPDELAASIFDTSLESEIVRPRARNFAMQSRTLRVPQWNGSDHTSGQLFGGISAAWAGEGGELDIQDAKLRQLVFETKKLAFIGKVSSELGEDSPAFAAEFERALTIAAGYHLDRAFLVGAGGSEPVGILNSPATIEIAKETSQAADTVTYPNLVKMFARSTNAMQSVWIVNVSTLPQLLQLTIPVGTGGTHLPVLSQAGGQMTILTRPVLVTEKTPALGEKGDVMFCDLSQYGVAMRAAVSLVISPHVYFSSDQLAFRLRARVDGKSMIPSPVQPENGPTLSPFVTLAVRA